MLIRRIKLFITVFMSNENIMSAFEGKILKHYNIMQDQEVVR